MHYSTVDLVLRPAAPVVAPRKLKEEENSMYRKLTVLALALAIVASGFAFTNARAATQQAGNPRTVFLGNLVNVFANDTVDINDTTAQIALVNVSRSLNNVRVLNNLLRQANILNDLTIENVSVLNNNQVLQNAFQNFLNNNNIDVDAVVGVAVLGTTGQDLLIVTKQAQ